MQYKGYVGVAGVDLQRGLIRGKVVNVRDTITFQGETVAKARKAFEESVDDYLDFCASLGEEPEKPFSGTFLVRVKPEVHRDLSAAAQIKGVSVNKLVGRVLTRLARKYVGPPAPAKTARPAKAGKGAPARGAGKKAAAAKK
jgi:predicted HicB family RNase H-like nuclease